MKLAELSVKNYQFTIIAFLALTAIGVSSFLNISRSEDPQFSTPGAVIVAVYPGASPADIEQLLIDPIEDALAELDDVKGIKSEADDGLMLVGVEFDVNTDADKKYDDVLRQINSIRPTLPQDLLSLDVTKFNTTNVNILQSALVSETASYKTLDDFADKLKTRLETVGGVKESETHAFPKREVRLSINLEKLAQLRLSTNQVIQLVQAGNSNIPGGSVDIGAKKFNIKTSGNFKTLDEIKRTVVGAAQGSVVYLQDIADVNWNYEEENYIGRFNGKRAVFVTANQKEGVNIFKVREGLEKELVAFEKTLPPDVKLERGFDQSKNVEHRIGGLSRDFLIAIALVLLTLLPLGFRASIIVMVSIPLSLLMGLFMMDSFGFNINGLSIVGFVIALGLLVDDSIVVVENISRFLRMGYTPVKAAVEATKQISAAVLGATATLIFAFLPMLFLPGGSGKYIRSLPVAVVVTIFASLVVSLTIIPFLASRLLKEEKDEHGNVFLQLLNRFIDWSYRRLLDWSLANPRTTLIIAFGLFAASLAIVPVVGFSLFPKAGTPQFLISIETPEGSALSETDKAAQFVEKILAESSEIEHFMTNVGKGNPQIYYNVIPKNEKNNLAEIFGQVRHYDGNATPKFYDELRAQFARYPNAKIELKEFENGPPIDAPIAMRLVGENLDTLKRIAADVEQLYFETDGTIYINNPVRLTKTDLKVNIDREKAGMFGVPIAEINRMVRLAIAGLTIGKFREEDGDEYNINLVLPHDGKPSLDALDKIYVSSVTGMPIPLRQLATTEFKASPTKINHYNKERSVTLTAYVKTGYNTDRVTKAILAKLDAYPFPSGYRYVAAGEIESRQESFGGLGTAILIAVFGVMATLVLEFGGFTSTLIVLSVVPLGVVGGLVALLLTGNSLSFTAVIGFIALIGIEVKTSILLVDFTNQLRAQGLSIHDAVLKAGQIRFVPVLLTSATAIGGLIPIAVEGSALYSPLAIVIIGGLISSTLLARLVTPVMYQLIPPKMENTDDAAGDALVPNLRPTV